MEKTQHQKTARRRPEPEPADSLPPHDEESERMLLACAVHKPDLLNRLTVDLFYLVEHQTILAAMQRMKADGKKSVESSEQFEHDLMLSLPRDAFARLNTALNELPTPEAANYWHDLVTDHAKARKLLGLKPDLDHAASGFLEGDKSRVHGIVKTLEGVSAMGGAIDVSSNMKVLDKQAGDILENIWDKGEALIGIPTGFKPLDQAMDGLQEQKFYVIAARPSKGKSALLAQIAYYAAASKYPTLFISLEMPSTEIYLRIASQISRVPLLKFKQRTASERDFQLFGSARAAIRQAPLTILDNTFALADIVEASERAVRGGVKLIVLDYVQKVTVAGTRENRSVIVGSITGAMKELAMKHHIAVLAAAQINRESEKEGRQPALADLRESGAIEQDADVVGFIHEEKANEIALIVSKNRSGPRVKIPMTFRGEIFRFECVE